MKTHALRFYVVSVTVLVFFVLWAVVAAKPWAAKPAAARTSLDPRLAALNRREQRLKRESAVVNRTLARRWHAYRVKLQAREAAIRALEQAHAQQVAAAQAAASTASSGAAPAGGTVVTTYTSAPAAAPAAPATQVVTLPPTVKVVTLPPATAPATSSGSSHP